MKISTRFCEHLNKLSSGRGGMFGELSRARNGHTKKGSQNFGALFRSEPFSAADYVELLPLLEL